MPTQHYIVPVTIVQHQSLAAIVANEQNPSIKEKLNHWINVNSTTENTKACDFSALYSIAQFSSQKQAIISWYQALP